MKTLRHPPLLFWLVACLLLAGTLLVLHELGRPGHWRNTTMTAVNIGDHRDGVEGFRLRLTELPKLATEQDETLQQWAEQTADYANWWATGALLDNPRIVELFEQAADAAADLAAAAVAGDSDGSSAAVTRLYNIGDLLTVQAADAGSGQ